MAAIDTNLLWRALGSFYSEYFPEEERVHWDAYWRAYADLNADLWGYAYQVDQARSVFSAPATFERLNVLLNLTLTESIPFLDMDLAAFATSAAGVITVRGFVRRDRLSFKAADVPMQGLVRIGVDVVAYTAVNVITVAQGPLAGYVTEAVFTLAQDPGHDYGDTLELGDSFTKDEATLVFRIPQVPGQTFVDATSSGEDVVVDATGRLEFGVAGVDREVIEYQSVTRVGDRYVFAFPTTWKQPGAAAGPALSFPHALGAPVKVSRVAKTRWQLTATGPVRAYGDNAVVVSMDNEPAPTASSLSLRDSRILQANIDFDLEVTLFLGDTWTTPTVNSTQRTAGFRITISGHVYEIVYRTARSGGGVVTETLVATGPSGSSARALAERPQTVVLRLARTAGVFEVLARVVDLDADFKTVASYAATGEAAVMCLVADDTGTGAPVTCRFDEVVRRLGLAVGSARLESAFQVSDLFPFRYAIDVNLASAIGLQEEPKTRSQDLVTLTELTTDGGTVVRCQGAGSSFVAGGVPVSGVLVFDGGQSLVYDSVDRVDADTFDFTVRGKLDPNLSPLAAGAAVTARSRALSLSEFQANGDGTLRLRDLPTRDRLWAPQGQVDDHLVQQQYGPLVDMTAVVSSDSYVRRVQGAWYALMAGPAIENIHIGVHLALGLPVAKVAGVVSEISERRDTLGRIIKRSMTISGATGAFVHTLDPGLPDIWNVELGDRVQRFQPLTRGVEVLDVDVDPSWGTRFGGLAPTDVSLERWNSFGILADIGALGDDASLLDAVRFALRIKPVWAKLFFSFTLGDLGTEHLPVADRGQFVEVMQQVEDLSFDEGPAPLPPQDRLYMGHGLRMGQGHFMGTSSPFRTFPAMGLRLFMGQGLTMGMDPRAWVALPNSDNHAREELTVTSVIEVFV